MTKLKISKFFLVILLLASFLCFYKLAKVPVSLFGDEWDVGYHAYSILKTGRDYSGNFMPLHFESLAEWRTPLYLYSAVPTVALFGISPWGVRSPAAIFGILGIWGIYLLANQIFKGEKLKFSKFEVGVGEIAALVLAINPWHIQYSRAGFEVSQLLAFLIFGLYFFFKSLKNPKFLWLSVTLLCFTPWIYSTAKLFTPFLLLFMFIVWRKEILRMPKKELVKTVVAGLVIGLPIALSTIFGGGSQRFGYVSVFTDPTTIPEVGSARQIDALVRGETGTGLTPTLYDRVIHNKYTFWGKRIVDNYFKAFSTEFLFNKGDLNLRHSIEGIGLFYKVEVVMLLAGFVFFVFSKVNRKKKALVFFWTLFGVVPAAITRDGGNHATRLILILPPLVFLISFGLISVYKRLKGIPRLLLAASYLLLLAIGFINYQHQFWVHNPWYSERWWHYGWKEAINLVRQNESGFDKVVISMSGEPAWIFFAGAYEYPPGEWQKNFPVGNDVELEGFGKVSHIDKYYFSSPPGTLYDWGKVLDKNTLYLANANEVKVDLIREPERTPSDLNLLGSVAFPSGEPAFFLFSGK